MSRKEKGGLLTSILLGLFLRAFLLDTLEFKGDELEAILVGLNVPMQHWWIQHGMDSGIGVPNAPVFSYIMGLFTILSQDPLVLTLFFVIINCIVLLISPFFFAVFTRKRNHFLLCVFLFSLSPYLILYSRKIWAQNLLLFLVMPIVLLSIYVYRKPWLYLLIAILGSIVFQLHQTGILFVSFLVLFFLISYRAFSDLENSMPLSNRLALSWSMLGIVLFLLTLLPYLHFLFFDFLDKNVVQKAGSASHKFYVSNALEWIIWAATGNMFWTYHIPGLENTYTWPVLGLPGPILALNLILTIPFIYGFFEYAKGAKLSLKRTPPFLSLYSSPLTFLIIAPSGFLLAAFLLLNIKIKTHPHYFTVILPFLIMITANGTTKLFEYQGRFKKYLHVLICLGLISYCLQYPFFLSYLHWNNGSMGEYGVIYREQKRVARQIYDRFAGRRHIEICGIIPELDRRPDPSKLKDLEDTVRYICDQAFDKDLEFVKKKGQGTKTLTLKNKDKILYLALEE